MTHPPAARLWRLARQGDLGAIHELVRPLRRRGHACALRAGHVAPVEWNLIWGCVSIIVRCGEGISSWTWPCDVPPSDLVGRPFALYDDITIDPEHLLRVGLELGELARR